MEAVQVVSSGDPAKFVPSGARYRELEIYNRTEVYEFQTTEPHDPRNCRISLPPITEEVFGVEESASSYNNTPNSNIRGMPLTYSIQVEAGDPEAENLEQQQQYTLEAVKRCEIDEN